MCEFIIVYEKKYLHSLNKIFFYEKLTSSIYFFFIYFLDRQSTLILMVLNLMVGTYYSIGKILSDKCDY